jgi:hypothetical protein
MKTKKKTKKNRHIGSSFSDFLKEEGIYEDVTAHAVKRVLAWQIVTITGPTRPPCGH